MRTLLILKCNECNIGFPTVEELRNHKLFTHLHFVENYSINTEELKIEHRKRLRKQYLEKNEEKILEQRKTRYLRNKERQNKRSAEYYRNNKDEIVKRGKEYRRENKERIEKQRSEYYQKNKERLRLKGIENYQKRKNKKTDSEVYSR